MELLKEFHMVYNFAQQRKEAHLMNNFTYENKTKVIFGRGGVKKYLLEGYGDTVLLAYGGGSIKKNGVYDEIIAILATAEKTVVEFPGIMPNPTCAKAQEGALDLARAMRCVRTHAEKYGIDQHSIAVMGFSAGGILAERCCSTGTAR